LSAEYSTFNDFVLIAAAKHNDADRVVNLTQNTQLSKYSIDEALSCAAENETIRQALTNSELLPLTTRQAYTILLRDSATRDSLSTPKRPRVYLNQK
jgi:hypothetical protein